MTTPLDDTLTAMFSGPCPPALNFAASDLLWTLSMSCGAVDDLQGEDALLEARERILHELYNHMENGLTEDSVWLLDNV